MTREQALDRYTQIFDELAILQRKTNMLINERNDLRKIILATEYTPQRVKRETNNKARPGATSLRVLQTVREYGKPITIAELHTLLPDLSPDNIRGTIVKSNINGLVNVDRSTAPVRYTMAVHADNPESTN